MKKIYKVPCYDLDDNVRTYHHIGDILVSRKYFYFAQELISGYASIEILKNEMVKDGEIKLIRGNTLEVKKHNRGAGLFILEQDLVQKNVVTKDELEHYITEYQSSEYNKRYEEMKVLKKEEKQAIKQKIKEIRRRQR